MEEKKRCFSEPKSFKVPVLTSNPSMATMSRVENGCGGEKGRGDYIWMFQLLPLGISWNHAAAPAKFLSAHMRQRATVMKASFLLCCRSGLILLPATSVQTSVAPGKVLKGSQSTKHTLGPLKLDSNLLRCKIISKSIWTLEVFDIQGTWVQSERNFHVEHNEPSYPVCSC